MVVRTISSRRTLFGGSVVRPSGKPLTPIPRLAPILHPGRITELATDVLRTSASDRGAKETVQHAQSDSSRDFVLLPRAAERGRSRAGRGRAEQYRSSQQVCLG